ncbi:MAG: GNAT family N-acetyltransferase [Bacteroidota bacterium]|nr:GNAT family N-acetyltransferase [Bacteroidota bacterium]
MTLTIKEISTKKGLLEFIKFPDKLYSQSKFYIPPIHSKELQNFSFKKNPALEFCTAKYWLVLKDKEIVGRVAGIINKKYNKKHNINYARFGWLDFIDDYEVLKLLLQTVEKWAISENMEIIHGPVGFTSFDASGVLIEGFNEIPTSFAHYNFPYYSKLIEKSGYEKDVDWVEFCVKMPKEVPDKIIKGSKIVQKRYNLHQLEIKKSKDYIGYLDEFFSILNESYKDLYAFTELTEKQVDNLKKKFFSLINPDYISIILDNEDKLIAFGVAIPSMSKALKESKGKLFPFGYYRIWRALHKNDIADLLLLAVKPDYQNKGVPAIIFEKIGQTFLNNKIKYLETTRELENNNKIKQLWTNYEFRQHKKARCYIKKLKK